MGASSEEGLTHSLIPLEMCLYEHLTTHLFDFIIVFQTCFSSVIMV